MWDLSSGVEGLHVGMGLHLIHEYWCAGSNKVTAFIVFEGLVLHVVLQSARFLICSHKAISATSFCGLVVYIEGYLDATLGLSPLFQVTPNSRYQERTYRRQPVVSRAREPLKR